MAIKPVHTKAEEKKQTVEPTKAHQSRYLSLIRPIDDRRRPLNEQGILFLSNIGHQITEDDIYKQFEDYGDVKRVDIHVNKCNGLRTGTAEVWMSNGTIADYVKRMCNGCDVFSDGRLIRIEKLGLLTPCFWKTVFAMLKLVKRDKEVKKR